MDRWKNKVAIVTGASSGIGAVTVKDLLKSGLIVVGLARREKRMRQIRDSLSKKLQSQFHPIMCDVTNEENVKNVFIWIERILGGPDILVNSAGTLRQTELIRPNNTKEIKEVPDTNVMGIVYCTREAFNSMKARKVDGHIINISRITSYSISNFGTDFASLNIYPATKFALRAMTETYRKEFQRAGTNIKITSISAGLVSTEMFPSSVEKFVKSQHKMLQPEDISNAILYVIGTPHHVQVHEIIMEPIREKI